MQATVVTIGDRLTGRRTGVNAEANWRGSWGLRSSCHENVGDRWDRGDHRQCCDNHCLVRFYPVVSLLARLVKELRRWRVELALPPSCCPVEYEHVDEPIEATRVPGYLDPFFTKRAPRWESFEE